MSWLSACPDCAQLQSVTGGRTAGDFWDAQLVVNCAVCKTELKRELVQDAAREIRLDSFERPFWQRFLDAGLIERERCIDVQPVELPDVYVQPARITRYHNARQRDYAARRSAKVPGVSAQAAAR